MPDKRITDVLKEIDEVGWGVFNVGLEASASEMEAVATKLLRIEDRAGTYNGGGGVERERLFNSSWLNAAEGAPASLRIQFHNEMAYSRSFPKYVAFAMFTPADTHGTTLVIDNVKVTRSLSEPLKTKMRNLGVRYVRLLYDESERGLPDYYNSWQAAFSTQDVDKAMAKATRGADMFAEWYVGPGGARRMKHTIWAPLFVTHPVQGELYFTSVLNRHASWQDGHAVFGALAWDQRPYQCFWGDGAAFSEGELEELREVHDGAMERIQLAKGDVIVIDNLRAQHGRTPFQGKRVLGLMLSDMMDRESRHKPPACFMAPAETPGNQMNIR